eukprot:gene23529-biopygen11843
MAEQRPRWAPGAAPQARREGSTVGSLSKSAQNPGEDSCCLPRACQEKPANLLQNWRDPELGSRPGLWKKSRYVHRRQSRWSNIVKPAASQAPRAKETIRKMEKQRRRRCPWHRSIQNASRHC